MTKTGAAARPPVELDADSLFDVIRLKQREITIGAIALIVLAAVLWLWRDWAVQNDVRAERALNSATNSFYSGNLPLAKTELEKVVGRYSGTSSAVQGTMLLAQVLFESGRYDDGIKRLDAAKGWRAARPFTASLEGLLANGYADQKKYDEAVKHYLAAADKAPFPADRDLYRADAARVLMVAGKREEARKIWADLASRIDSPAVGEAKIRLGELTGTPAARP